MAAPIGNQNAAKAKMWRDAILRAVAKRMDGKGLQSGLDDLADKFVGLCAQGDAWALKEFGDRLDGKPAQSVHVSGEDGGPVQIQTIEIKAVDP